MTRAWTAIAVIACAATLVLTGAIAGFFYAYSVSVMRGLDAAEPQHAIAAMQGINATVRNVAFAPAFFGMPAMAALSAVALAVTGQRPAALAMIMAATTYVLGAFVPTFVVNVPMNDALAAVIIPSNVHEAGELWTRFSAPWTWWNHFRLAFSMASLLLVGLAIFLCGLRYRL
jgi:uncharacterized membrane protein